MEKNREITTKLSKLTCHEVHNVRICELVIHPSVGSTPARLGALKRKTNCGNQTHRVCRRVCRSMFHLLISATIFLRPAAQLYLTWPICIWTPQSIQSAVDKAGVHTELSSGLRIARERVVHVQTSKHHHTVRFKGSNLYLLNLVRETIDRFHKCRAFPSCLATGVAGKLKE